MQNSNLINSYLKNSSFESCRSFYEECLNVKEDYINTSYKNNMKVDFETKTSNDKTNLINTILEDSKTKNLMLDGFPLISLYLSFMVFENCSSYPEIREFSSFVSSKFINSLNEEPIYFNYYGKIIDAKFKDKFFEYLYQLALKNEETNRVTLEPHLM